MRSITPKLQGRDKGGAELLSRQVHSRAQAGHHVIPGANHSGRQTANPIITQTNVVLVGVGYASPVAANATGVTTAILVLEPRRRGKVQTGEGAGLA